MEVSIIPFSHLDLFWTGTREQCLSRGNYIISKALDLLEKYDDFRFLIETVNFLDNYLDCHPEDVSRIKKLLKSNRLELASLWAGIYLNMPGGETLARNILLANDYAGEKLDYKPELAHFGDLPGYTPQYPQIASQADIKYALMSRGGPTESPLFIWESPSGDRIPAYYVTGYATLAMGTIWHRDYESMKSGRLEAILRQKLDGKKHPILFHWGSDLYAPDENIIKNVRRWNEENSIKLNLSTFKEYFFKISKISRMKNAPEIPSLSGELPSSWPNIESSWPDIWPEDMPCEAALSMAEFLSVFCMCRGWNDYPSELLDNAWKSLLDGMDHNQNGQGGEIADNDKLQLKLWSRYTAEKIIDRMSQRIVAGIRRPHDRAFPIVVFNSMSWRRSEIVVGNIAVFGKVRSCDIHDFENGLQLVDEAGNTVPYIQLSRHEGLSVNMSIAFRAEDVPAAGYKTYYIVPGTNPINESETCCISLDSDIDFSGDAKFFYSTDRSVLIGPRRSCGCNTYENDFFKLTVDCITGEIDVYDVKHEKKLFEKMCIVGVEERRGNYIFDMTASGRAFPARVDEIETLENNALRCRIQISGEIYGMNFRQAITMFKNSDELEIENVIDWTEPRWIRIEQLFPYAAAEDSSIRYGVPYGYVKYPEIMGGTLGESGDEIDAEDRNRLRLCRHWVDIGDDSSGVTVAADHRMWEFEGQLLRAYMVRGCGYCFGIKRDADGNMENIARPPKGQYTFKYSLRPRYTSLAESNSYRCGWELNNPLHSTGSCETSNIDRYPASDGLLDFTDSSAVVTAIKKSEDGDGLIIRAFEATGNTTKLKIPDLENRIPSQTNILEQIRQPLSERLKPFEIETIVFDKIK
ncbi:MAG TPA: glycoside hydrolase family 38 C-terminal domain-containing protein [Phycisphaerae bacterium]|nr:glycoside hydrolase family 38 C-terminal domain-containing protein [Phycisphaerae bacterium]